MTDFTSRFPDLLPMEQIREGPESHEFRVIEYDDGTTSTQYEYVPHKSPVLEVEEVAGIVDGESFNFTEGTDYAVIDDDSDGRLDTIDFDIGGEQPDDNTEFEITYIARSIIVRYVESYEDEFHRVQDDIDDVIDSHYVDEASNTGFVDNFEDEQLVEYDVQSGLESEVRVQTARSLEGSWSLRLDTTSAGSVVRIASTAGLPLYPKRGDTFTYYTYLTDTDDISHFDFMYSVGDGGTERYYRSTIDAANDEFTIQKQQGGAKQDVSSQSLDNALNEWVRVEITVEPIGDIVATLYDADGSKIATSAISDIEYESGGIRFAAENPNTTAEVYFDSVDIIERKSTDLDRVGAIFGELGRRRGRSDDEYATFLRSIVQSFSGRGTLDGIKFAVASALGLDPEQIVIDEDFTTNEYTVNIDTPFPPHELITLTELADLADPSGVKFGSITYDVANERVDFDDDITVSTGQPVNEQASVADTVGVNPNLTTVNEQATVDDTPAVNPNKTTVFEDATINDAAAVNPNKTIVAEDTTADDLAEVNPDTTTVAEDTTANDATNTTTTAVAWDDGDWDNMDWATEHN